MAGGTFKERCITNFFHSDQGTICPIVFDQVQSCTGTGFSSLYRMTDALTERLLNNIRYNSLDRDLILPACARLLEYFHFGLITSYRFDHFLRKGVFTFINISDPLSHGAHCVGRNLIVELMRYRTHAWLKLSFINGLFRILPSIKRVQLFRCITQDLRLI